MRAVAGAEVVRREELKRPLGNTASGMPKDAMRAVTEDPGAKQS